MGTDDLNIYSGDSLDAPTPQTRDFTFETPPPPPVVGNEDFTMVSPPPPPAPTTDD